MKPVIHTDKNIISDLQGEKIAMSFDEESLPHLMRRFIDLYKDREAAVLREYSCNAYDSHVDAGITDPIEVTLPSKLNPILTIKDHGVGLSIDDLRKIWSKYGASTKRESDEVIGSFGLGSKSALTYTDQFTVQAVKDGREALVSISFNSLGIGELTIVLDQATCKPNGVEIVIPSKWPNNFAEKAADLFQWWPDGSVLVDGEQPDSFEDRGTFAPREVAPGIYLQEVAGRINYDEVWKSVLVMGGVPYPITIADLGLDFHDRYENRTQRVIAFVDIGTVEPIPSREGLTDTPENQEALRHVGEQVQVNAARVAQELIDEAPDLYEAIQVIQEVQGTLPSVLWPEHKPWTWQGEEVPELIVSPDDIEITEHDNWGRAKRRTGGFVMVNRNAKGKQHQRVKHLNWGDLQTVLYFKGFDLDTFTPSHRNRLKQWFVNNAETVHSSPDRVVLCNNLPDSPLIKHERVYDWDEVRNTKLPRNTQTERGRLVGSYDRLSPRSTSTYEIQAAVIDDTKPIYYYLGNETKRPRYELKRSTKALPYVAFMHVYEPDATYLAIPETRREKLLRQFPHAKEIREAIGEHRDRFTKQLTDKKKKALFLQQCGRPYNILKGATLVDPDLAEAAKLIKLDVSKEQQIISQFSQIDGFPIGLPVDFDPLENYPLLDGVYHTKEGLQEHIVVYLNAAYPQIVRNK